MRTARPLPARILAAALLLATASGQDAKLDELMRRQEAIGFSGSVLVTRGGKTLLDAGYGLADRAADRRCAPDTVFDAGSVTKQFTATAILLLEQRGKLRTTDSIAEVFEDAPEDKRAITLQHLLNHTSGLPADVPVGSATVERSDLVARALRAELTSPPGEEYRYNNVGYMLLGAVVEVVSGERYEDFMKTELFAPAGLESTSFLHEPDVDAARTAVGYEGDQVHGPAQLGWYSWGLRGAGGVLTTTGDLRSWIRATESDRILRKKARAKLLEPNLSTYACGWMVRDDDPGFGRVIEHGGTTRGFEAEVARYPDHGVLVVVLSNDRGKCKPVAWNLGRAACGLEYAVPEEVVEADADALAALAGTYALAPGGELVVSVSGDALAVRADPEAAVALSCLPGPPRLADDLESGRRARAIVERMAAGDAGGLEPLVSQRYPGWNVRLLAVWRGWVRDHGAFAELRVLGTQEGSGGRTFVAIELASRTIVMGLSWEASGRLAGFELDGGLEWGEAFRPAASEDAFVAQDPGDWAARAKRLTFRRDERGRPTALSLVLGSKVAVAELRR